MQPRMYSAATTVVLATAALFILFSSFGRADPVSSSTPASALDAPLITQVNPSSAPNDLDTTIIITGTGFTAELSDTIVITPPRVYLGNAELNDVGWITTTTLTATVPWGMNPGAYTITVTNPDGMVGSLENAFTVTQAIGVWTTDGPYGGMIVDLTVSPVTSQTAFALTNGVGVFRTQDGGDNWSLALVDVDPRGVMYGVAPTHTLYYWGGSGLWRSENEGLTFQHTISDGVGAFVQHPFDERQMWTATGNGIKYTSNGGADWEIRSTGLPNDLPVFLAIDPIRPSILYTIFMDGQVFKTTDAGLHWTSASVGLPPTRLAPSYSLVVNPFAPDVLLYCHFTGPGTGYRSTDGGGSWSPITIDPSYNATLTDFAFSPYISGTVYASWIATHRIMAVSNDGGITWSSLGDHTATVIDSLALDPTSGLPAYLGGGSSGTWRSRDGGQTWELATSGITGLQVRDIAVSPEQPEKVYAAGQLAGGLISENAGHGWRLLDLPYTAAETIAIDPQDPKRLYISPGSDIFRSGDGGATWQNIYLPDWAGVFIETMAVDPLSSSVIYAAGRDNDAWSYNGSIGVAFRSTDYGTTWAPITFTSPISVITDLIIDPLNNQTLFVAAGNWTTDMSPHPGKGVFRSIDGGATWRPITLGMGDVPAFALAIHPEQPQTIYASAWLTSESKVTVFKSTDGGDTWAPTSLRATRDYLGVWAVPSLVIDPLAPNTLYAGAADGLYRTLDGGVVWTRAAGGLGYTQILALAAASSTDRTIVYAGTIGGASSGGQLRYVNAAYVQGGVYKQTVDHRSMTSNVYLPLVLRTATQYALNSSGVIGWDSANVIDPVVITDSGHYKMWFTGVGRDGISRIGYATSTNGSHWTKYAGNPVLDIGTGGDWDTDGMRVDAVIKEGATYRMWYESGGYQHLGLATSTDGLHWIKYAGNPVFDVGPSASWDEGIASFSAVISDSGSYKMWYAGAGASGFGGPIRIGYASSPNGITWTKLISNPVLGVGPSTWDAAWVIDPSVVSDGVTYKMWYSGLDAFPFFNHTLRIGLATSTAGISWTKSISNPVVDVEPSSWDKQTATAPSVIFDGSTYHMWYHGGKLGGLEMIGYATSPDGITWTKYSGNPVLIPTQLLYLPLITKSN
jgi:photosystem II stability/assembly factor-like uncharacterized protein